MSNRYDLVSMPTWVIDHLDVTTGARPGAAHATLGRCPTCHGPVLRGLDNHPYGAFDATVDPVPLTAAGEAVALLTGLGTYELLHEGAGYRRLWRRGRYQIAARPAGATDHGRLAYDVYPAHTCQPATRWLPLATRSAFDPPDHAIPDHCPF